MARYDAVIVGSGIFGSVVARELTDAGLKVLVLERRDHIGGNCWSYRAGGIDIHAYGPHILYTNYPAVWNYFNRFVVFQHRVISPLARFENKLFNLPFSMRTFYELWGVTTPTEAKYELARQVVPCKDPDNLEEYALSKFGRDLYEKLIKGYVEKQYGKACTDLPASLLERMSLLFTFDSDYLHTTYQGVPEDGWSALFDRLLDGIDVRLSTDYLEDRQAFDRLADLIVYTGGIDEFFGYRYGALEWRGRRFEISWYEEDNHQGAALINYTDVNIPELRSIEHKLFTDVKSKKTAVTKEYAVDWTPGEEPFYSINDIANQNRLARYLEAAKIRTGVVFGGRLGEYRYLNIQDTALSAWRFLNRRWGISFH